MRCSDHKSPFTRRFCTLDVFEIDVALSIQVDCGLVDGGESAFYFARGTHHQAARRNNGAFGGEPAGGDDAAFANDDTVEDGGAHADEAAGFDRAAVERDGMAHRDVIVEDERILVLHHVQDGTVLNIGAGADADVVDVTADNAERPNAGVFPNDHVADEDRCGINVSGGGDLRALVAVGADVRLAGNAHK